MIFDPKNIASPIIIYSSARNFMNIIQVNIDLREKEKKIMKHPIGESFLMSSAAH